MILTPAISPLNKRYIRHYKRAIEHSIHLSKHTARVLVVTVVVAALSFAVINAVLLSIQITSLPLFLKVGGISLSLQTPGAARVLLTNYGQSQNLNLTIQDKNYQVPTEKAGITLDVNAVMSSIQHPSGWDKIPVIYAIRNLHRSFPLQYALSDQKLGSYIDTLTLPQNQTPTDASIVIPGDTSQPAYIIPEQLGYKFDTSTLASQISSAVAANGDLAVVIRPQVLPPKVTAAQLAAALEQTNAMLGQRLIITNGTKSYELTNADLRKIVRLDTSLAVPGPAINRPAVVELLRAHSNLFYTVPATTKISTVDGNIVSQTSGSNGQAVNIEASADGVVEALQNGRSTQVLTMSTVKPGTDYLRSYTATSAGLLAMIKDFAATHPGSYAAVTIELGGNRSAYFNDSTSTVPASTYKLFVAYAALKKIEQGTLSFNTQTSNGSLDYCMQQMILISSNECAKAILNLIGWSEVESQVLAAGFANTNINNQSGGYMSTTASDLAKLLQGFYGGSLLSKSSIDYLFNLMKNQIYRSGIPAGSPDAVVADKVGFLESWNHDAAIVYASKATYILVILTTNSSFSQIKALSSQIYNLYNQ